MIQAKECFPEAINSPVRKIGARVELFEGSTLVNIFQYTDALQSFTVERVGDESKFFGFGVCHKLNVKLIDKDRKINISTKNTIEIEYGAGCEFMYPYPAFYVTEVHRDENTNELSITAYDKLYTATKHTINELGLPEYYDIRNFVIACAAFLGLPLDLGDNPAFDTYYLEGANFDGDETIRDALDDVAEATQTVYYINHKWDLVFKRPDVNGDPVLIIGKDKYFDLDSKTNRRLSDICSATELGDNVTTTSGITGTTQYIRENAFWVLRDDIDILLNNALAAVSGMTINQFDCSWRGDFSLEVGDKIGLITKDDEIVYAYVYNDTITYNGFLSEQTGWHYQADDDESADNPVTLGDALKKTYAKVDKVNQTITMAVNKVEGYENRLTQIELDTEGITASVQQIQATTNDKIDALGEELEVITNRVEATMTPEAVEIKIQEAIGEGVNKITTETGFTFNDVGLTVSKSGSEMTTTITEDGMSVYKDGDEVLTADNTGVKAIDLRAITYLHIGTYSRFQDYEGGRTGCFWIV